MKAALINPVLIFATLTASVLTLAFFYQEVKNADKDAEIAVIAADSKPFKNPPESEGGRKIPYLDKKLYSRLNHEPEPHEKVRFSSFDAPPLNAPDAAKARENDKGVTAKGDGRLYQIQLGEFYALDEALRDRERLKRLYGKTFRKNIAIYRSESAQGISYLLRLEDEITRSRAEDSCLRILNACPCLCSVVTAAPAAPLRAEIDRDGNAPAAASHAEANHRGNAGAPHAETNADVTPSTPATHKPTTLTEAARRLRDSNERTAP